MTHASNLIFLIIKILCDNKNKKLMLHDLDSHRGVECESSFILQLNIIKIDFLSITNKKYAQALLY